MDKRLTLKNSNDQQNGTREIAPWKIAPPSLLLTLTQTLTQGRISWGQSYGGIFR